MLGLSAGKIQPMIEYHWTWKFIPANCVPSRSVNPDLTLGMGPIELIIGTVNSETFNGFPAGTLLFTAANIKTLYGYQAVTGQVMYDIE